MTTFACQPWYWGNVLILESREWGCSTLEGCYSVGNHPSLSFFQTRPLLSSQWDRDRQCMQSGGSSTSGHVLPPSCDHSCQLPPGKSSVWETHLPHPFTYCFYSEEKAMPKRVTSVRFLVCLLLCSLVVHHRTKCPPAAGPHGACQEPTLA